MLFTRRNRSGKQRVAPLRDSIVPRGTPYRFPSRSRSGRSRRLLYILRGSAARHYENGDVNTTHRSGCGGWTRALRRTLLYTSCSMIGAFNRSVYGYISRRKYNTDAERYNSIKFLYGKNYVDFFRQETSFYSPDAHIISNNIQITENFVLN